MLTGSDLLAKFKEVEGLSDSEQCRACGYVSTKKNGEPRLNYTAYYKALLEAKGIKLGAGNLISGGTPISGFTDEVRYLGHGRIDLQWLGLEKSQYLPVSLVLIAIVYIIFWIFLNKSKTGKWIYAIGGNPNAARASGINVNKILIIVYSLCGFLSGIGALILAGRTDSGYPNAGLQSELDAIAACIIGGASFFGGRGTVLGVFAGVMIMGILRNGLNLMDVSSFWQQVLIGSIIVLAVYIDVLRRDIGTRK